LIKLLKTRRNNNNNIKIKITIDKIEE